MRPVLSIALVVGVLAAAFSEDLLITSFYAKRAYIAANLCEQRSRPGNTCRGCCQLAKRLNDEQGKGSAVPPANSRDREAFQSAAVEGEKVLFSPPATAFEFSEPALYPFDPFTQTIDHPPQDLLMS